MFLLHRWENLLAQAALSSADNASASHQNTAQTLNSHFEKASLNARARFMINFIGDSSTTNGLQSICWTSEKVALNAYTQSLHPPSSSCFAAQSRYSPTDEAGSEEEMIPASTRTHLIRLHQVSAQGKERGDALRDATCQWSSSMLVLHDPDGRASPNRAGLLGKSSRRGWGSAWGSTAGKRAAPWAPAPQAVPLRRCTV